MKISQYPLKDHLNDSDTLIIDTPEGTKSLSMRTVITQILQAVPRELPTTYNEYLEAIDGFISLDMRRKIWGGRNLGSAFTSAQKAAIQSGTFTDLFIGDYVTAPNGRKYIIADFDRFYEKMLLLTGDGFVHNHHLTLVTPPIDEYEVVLMDSTSNAMPKNFYKCDYFVNQLASGKPMYNTVNSNISSIGLSSVEIIRYAQYGGTVDMVGSIRGYASIVGGLSQNEIFGFMASPVYATDYEIYPQLPYFQCKPYNYNPEWYEMGTWLTDVGLNTDTNKPFPWQVGDAMTLNYQVSNASASPYAKHSIGLQVYVCY